MLLRLSSYLTQNPGITPALVTAKWDVATQVREEVTFTAGRVLVRGKMVTRGKAKRADYILYYKPNIPLPHPGIVMRESEGGRRWSDKLHTKLLPAVKLFLEQQGGQT